MDIFLIALLVSVLGILILTLWMMRRELPKREANVVKIREKPDSKITVGEATQLYESISESLVRNIRSAMGLDIPGGVIEPEVEEEPGPVIHELDLDPFMQEITEWQQSAPEPNEPLS